VGLTTDQMSDMAALSRLAANPGEASREEIYLAVTALYRVQGAHLSPRERDLVQEIIRTLTPNVAAKVRAGLVKRLADDSTAPAELILLLAADAVDIARPIILRNPLLGDHELLQLIAETGVAHHEVIATRADLGDRVRETLKRMGSPTVQLALARNTRAKIPATLEHRRSQDAQADSPVESENRLIEKLAASGQLKASFLMRVLNQGQIELFDAGLARLLGLPVTGLRERFYERGPKAVALACRAAGIDRCVFSTIFTLSRKAHGIVQPLQSNDMAEIDAAFRTAKPAALDLLQAA
jgi:uncharacterized protein (DUF2336 family)